MADVRAKGSPTDVPDNRPLSGSFRRPVDVPGSRTTASLTGSWDCWWYRCAARRARHRDHSPARRRPWPTTGSRTGRPAPTSRGFPHPSLVAALQLRLDYPERSGRRRYRELAAFAGRGALPHPALRASGGLSATDAGDLLARFSDRAVLRSDPVTSRVELHDLQSGLAPADPGDSLPSAHDQLPPGTRPAARAARRPGR